MEETAVDLRNRTGREERIGSPDSPAVPWQEPSRGDSRVLWRYAGNPLITRGHMPGIQGVYNSAVVRFRDHFAGVFRVEDQTRFPRLHAGFSHDGLAWKIDADPMEFLNCEHVASDYAYDPRVTPCDGDYLVTWCGGECGPTIAIARTSDFRIFERLDNAFLPFNRNGVLFPRRIRGKYLMLSRPSDNGHTPFGDIYLSESPDLIHWGRHRLVMRKGGEQNGQWWQRTKIGAGPVPIETPEGWLLIYHGVMDTCNGFVYSFGAAILDLEEPWQVRFRCKRHLLTPEADYEVFGHVPNVVFPCAAVHSLEEDRVAIYYGAADTHSCLAFGRISQILDFVKSQSDVF